MDKRQLVNLMLEHIDGGKAVACAYLGLNESQFNNKLYENKGSKFFSIDELLALQELSKTKLFAEWIAGKSNMIAVPLADGDIDTVDLHEINIETQAKRGELDHEIFISIKNGGYINEDEKKKIKQIMADYLAKKQYEIKAILKVYKGIKKPVNCT